jgi:hypothetical protein
MSYVRFRSTRSQMRTPLPMTITLGSDVKCIYHILLREIERQAQMMLLKGIRYPHRESRLCERFCLFSLWFSA